MARALDKFRLALMTSFSHDVFGTAKAAAYSAILCLFPTILVLTTLLALAPESDTVRGEMRAAFAEVLPADTMTLLHDYFNNQKVRGVQVVSSAIVVSLVAAMGMMLSLMGGFAARMTYRATNGTSGLSAGWHWRWFPCAWDPWHSPPCWLRLATRSSSGW